MNTTLIAIVAGALVVPAALGQGGQSRSGKDGSLTWSINFGGQAETSSNFKRDAAGGSVTVYRASASLDLGYKINDTWSAGLGAENEHVFFNFKNATGLIAGSPRPFSHVTRITLAPYAHVHAG